MRYTNYKSSLLLIIAGLLITNQIFAQNNEQTKGLGRRFNDALGKAIVSERARSRVSPAITESLADSMLYGTLANISRPVAPFSYGKYFIFVDYQEDDNIRTYISFEDEHYMNKYMFVPIKENKNVRVFVIKKTHENRSINYRLVVDGVWGIDRSNTKSIVDERGVQVSTVYVSRMPSVYVPSIVKIDEDTVRLYLYLGKIYSLTNNTQGNLVDVFDEEYGSEYVFLVTSLANWDPYAIMMNQDKEVPQLYWVDLPAKEGQHFYYYRAGHNNFLDPHNQTVFMRPDSGDKVNAFYVSAAISDTTGAMSIAVSTTEISR